MKFRTGQASPRVALFRLLIQLSFLAQLASTVRDFRSLKIESTLHAFFEDNEQAATKSCFVEFEDDPDDILNTFNVEGFSSPQEFHIAYKRELRLMRKESQADVLEFLKDKKVPFSSFWLTNQVYVKDCTLDLCEALNSFENVKLIREEQIYHIHKPLHEGPVEERPANGSSILENEWNIEKIMAPAAWTVTEGQGITIAIIDTGIRPTHECFQGRQIAAWLDAVNGKTTPYDDHGHGTHCAGIAAGALGIGVAPKANIMACKACTSSGSCAESALQTCSQFVADKRPHLVSCSWGGSVSNMNAAYTSTVNAWKTLNIVPMFSAGNSGPSCGTMGSPADYPNVVSVGSTTNSDSLSDFSSRGQCKSGMIGPTLCAPGSSIRSAWPTSDSAYKTISGTSMACPHVAGLVALMKSSNAGIAFDDVVKALIATSATNLVDPQQTCGGTTVSQKPNNMYGNGRILCDAAVQQAVQLISSSSSSSSTPNGPSQTSSQQTSS